MLAGAEDHLATFSFSGVSQTIVKHSTWGQCPQVLAGTAQKVAKSTRLCSYTGYPSTDSPPLLLSAKAKTEGTLGVSPGYFPLSQLSIRTPTLSVPKKNRNRRKIAAFSNRKVLNRRFCRRKIAEKSPENRRRNRRKIASDFLGRGIEIAAFPRFQIAAFSGR